MYEVFQSSETEAAILVDARNAFNALNRQVALRNIQQLCPPLSKLLTNTYRDDIDLFIDGETIYSQEGTTQGDPLAMAMYAIAITPLINTLESESMKQIWYADDAAAGGKLSHFKAWWDRLTELGPDYGYYPNASKSWLIVKDTCSVEEVQWFLETLDTTKANGPDGISAWMLKETALSIAPSVTKLFNLSIQSGCFPVLWKMSNVVPVPKSNDHSNPSNYRPISLLPILSKLLEHHIHFLISEYLSLFHPISNDQWGFQAGKSTVSALLATTYTWFQQLESGGEICAIFFDIKKAFDTVPHRALLVKLKQLNLNPTLIRWICSYLMGRKQKVVVEGETSEPIHVVSGVPQGSVLGPLLFIIYIDSINDSVLSVNSKTSQYADDMLLTKPVRTTADYADLQTDIDSLNRWVTENHLTFNYSKCKYMLISRKRIVTCPPDLKLEASSLERVQSYKYLGLNLTSNLSWSDHINSISTKAKKLVGLLYRRFYRNTDSQSLLQLYLALVRPHTEYASQVWNPHLQKDIGQLERVQKFALRMCAKQWDIEYTDLLNYFNLPSLVNRRRYLSLSTMYKIVHNLVYFPPDVFVPRVTALRSSSQMLYNQPFAHTNAFFHSFVPSTCSAWNNLPTSVTHANSISSFKSSLRNLL